MEQEVDFRLSTYGKVKSTNDIVKQALDAHEAEGLVVRAREQTRGYGRHGRTWSSDEGGLYQSLLLRPQGQPDFLPTLSLFMGVVLRRALEKLIPCGYGELLLKWPNDLVAKAPNAAGTTKKLGGISCEVHGRGVCVGMGVNVFPTSIPFLGMKNFPAFLSEFGFEGAVEDVGDRILVEFNAVYGLWQRQGFAPFVAEYAQHASLTGHDVILVNNDGKMVATGRVRRVDRAGRLVLKTPSGQIKPIYSGEVHLL